MAASLPDSNKYGSRPLVVTNASPVTAFGNAMQRREQVDLVQLWQPRLAAALVLDDISLFMGMLAAEAGAGAGALRLPDTTPAFLIWPLTPWPLPSTLLVLNASAAAVAHQTAGSRHDGRHHGERPAPHSSPTHLGAIQLCNGTPCSLYAAEIDARRAAQLARVSPEEAHTPHGPTAAEEPA
eukprot:CAMPEP_0179010558 /NCGR_PEP_ID=MMETSP0796-20121207/181_1 /TAXON_ID=73915 /ORGANISM="Pyrodinium bahamense, Strain pbaha01" /LENGTH=181 /DNA_ID=CAMNT_0020705851 /DNA_START=154 /DNA_END=695 /DNA_ORIENTATION=-